MFLLDTNVVSEMRRRRPHGAAAAWLRSTDPRLLREGVYELLSMDAEIWRTWAKLMHRKSDMLADDARIAAIAVVHGLVVVTRNIRDFRPFKVPTFNPFAASS